MTAKTKASFIGINLGHGRAASDQLNRLMANEYPTVALVQEPLINRIEGNARFAGEGCGVYVIAASRSLSTRAAIFFNGDRANMPILVPHLSNNDCTTAL